ncbi:FAD/NAD(P)-binding protein [Glarea lozoyensis ATCC 20868]|uniref:FAD/NAD(P)-binding protein n=1 Tax=Glarea lozoyensis (strain ATCC 20868 / MF5171) TaxID=1116229 RepID=S3DMJ0_GLAL2|nr:FAD/NAD(P)-binding protein [Glarea lozoyensis ATCC 20868]EPE27723.1 FAD/NAD(P)-binding protein [Glarea lozoyensis ATCC 20868]
MLIHKIFTVAFPLASFSFFLTCQARPVEELAYIKRHVSELDDSYDFIIVGGGTAGITVADRLSEDSRNSVLVVEYGYIDPSPDILMPAPANNDRYLPRFYNYSSVPQTELNNATTIVYAAAIVGGGSAVDHMMFDRGSADDYDNWEKLQNPGWGWKGLLPYFQKSVTFIPPTLAQQKEFGYTYDESAYGGHGPIYASYPPFQWPQQKTQWNSWLDLGVKATKEGAGGQALGLFWIPSALDPKNETRSYAKSGHHDRAVRRENYHLLTGYKAREISISRSQAEGVKIQARDGSDKTFTNVKANQEVIIAAGSFGSPALLQRSGIGPKGLLKKAGIDVKLDLPGVGQNLQDHAASVLVYIYASNTVPNSQTAATNATFAAQVQALYYQNRTGPLTVGYGNSVVFLPLQTFDTNYKGVVANLSAQNSLAFLPSGYEISLKQGYAAQKKLLLASYSSKSSAMLEVFFNGDPTVVNVLQKPMSRGSVYINITDPFGDPLIDPRVFSNPVDMDIAVSMYKYTRKWFQTPSHATLTPFEILPGSSVISDEDIKAAIRQFSTPTIGHALGTCAMMPLEMGGVVDSELLVHGIKRLSVVDASIMPLAPATHLDATVYAVAEKAADLIKRRAR